ncbi:MAG: hypothetical protein P4L16_00845 [Chlamydiales bacterium]|nr:hypothetical protein [Chlamydiales bacterium]
MSAPINESSNQQEPQEIQVNKEAQKGLEVTQGDCRTGAMIASAISGLSKIEDTLVTAYNQKVGGASATGVVPEVASANLSGTKQVFSPAEITSVQSSISAVAHVDISATFSDMSKLLTVYAQLSKFLSEVQNVSTLSPTQEAQFKSLTSEFIEISEQLKNTSGQMNVQNPLTDSIKNFIDKFVDSLKLPAAGSSVSAWISCLKNNNPEEDIAKIVGEIKEYANKNGIDASNILKLSKLKDDVPYTGIAGEIEKWIFGSMMNNLDNKISIFQHSISENAAFLNLLGPMEEKNQAFFNLFDFHLPPTPEGDHVKTWVAFYNTLNVLSNELRGTGFMHWRSMMAQYILKLSGVADGPPPNKKLKSLVNGIRNNLNAVANTVSKFLQHVDASKKPGRTGHAIVWYLFSWKKVTVTVEGQHEMAYVLGTNLKSNMRVKFEKFASKFQNVAKSLKNIGASVQSTNTTDQSQLQLQMNFMQEFMQAGPTIIQTLNELMKAIAQNMKGQ